MTMVQQRQPFPDAVAERVIQLLRAGTAPWQQRHSPGEGPELPMNPANGNRYKGINAVQLMSQGRDDPRWLTHDQAQELGAQVRQGEQGTRVQFWKLAEERQKSDNGRPVTDSNGDPVMERVPLERPRAMTAVVFNAEQIDGMPPLPQRQQPSEAAAAARVQALLEGSGAKVRPVDGTNAYYRAASDTLQMPPSAEFASEASRAATVLRELAHWTGHESRLGRDLSQPYGSAEHAKEQLRAELAALFMGEAMGVGQEPANPGAYTDAWVHLIQEDPLVLLRATAQAEQIQGYVLKFDQGAVLAQQQPAQVQAPGQGQSEEQTFEAPQQAAPTPLPTQEPPAVSTAAEENARINAALAAVQQQSAPPQQHQPRPARTAGTRSTNMAPKADPESEFAQALRSMGCLVPQGHPKMDGQPYRVPVTGDRGGQKSGFYVGHLDGLVPAGYIKNNRTGQETRWKAKGYNLTDEQRNRLQAEAAAKLAQRRAEEARRHEATAQRVSRQLAGLRPVDQPTPYLRAKGVQPHPGAFTDAQGKTTFLPAIDKTGKHWTTQYIGEDGIKRFAKDGHKEGCFHVLGGMEALKRVPVIVMGEGYATMATIKEAVGHATVAAFDSGNLPSVARAMRELFPTKPIIVAGDDDRAVQLTQGFNPGREKAEAAAAAVGGRAIFPVFAPGENTYPATLPPVTPATYRAHVNASELLARGGLTAEATQALQADLLKPGQISALEQMKKHTDFNDLAQKSVLGREALLRQVLPEVKQAQQIHHAEVQKQAQQQSQREAQGVRQRQGHGLRAG